MSVTEQLNSAASEADLRTAEVVRRFAGSVGGFSLDGLRNELHEHGIDAPADARELVVMFMGVQRIIRDHYGTHGKRVRWFTQTDGPSTTYQLGHVEVAAGNKSVVRFPLSSALELQDVPPIHIDEPVASTAIVAAETNDNLYSIPDLVAA